MSTPRITFRHLLDERSVRTGDPSAKRAASEASALRSLMRWRDRKPQDAVDGVLGLPSVEFDTLLTEFEGTNGHAPATVAAYRSRLRDWNQRAALLLAAQSIEVTPETTGQDDLTAFPKAISAALSAYIQAHPDASVRSVDRALQFPINTLSKWKRQDCLHLRRSDLTVGRVKALEQFLGLSAGTLVQHLRRITAPRMTYDSLRKKGAVRRRERDCRIPLNMIPYRPSTLPPKFACFWEKFLEFKTTPLPVKNLGGTPLQSSGAGWRQLDPSKEAITSQKCQFLIKTFLGWLMLPSTEYNARIYIKKQIKIDISDRDLEIIWPLFIGRGLKEEELNLGHLLDPEMLGRFLQWKKIRHGRADASLISAVVLPLIRAELGFLTQQVEYVWDYKPFEIDPIDLNKSDWKTSYQETSKKWEGKCKELRQQIRKIMQQLPPRPQTARERLAPILHEGDPIGVITKIIQKHADARPVGRLRDGAPGSQRLAIWVRDQLLLRMLAANPLRNRNFREMKWRVDNNGNLYQTNQSAWRLRFKPQDFKNERGAANTPYDVPIPESLWPLITQYITLARPILINKSKQNDMVFLTNTGEAYHEHKDLSQRLYIITGLYMGAEIDSLGIRTHAFRHIIATAWLRENPKDYLTVAQILHDNLETVIANYGHTTPADGLVQHYAWLENKIPPIKLAVAA